MNFEVIKTYTLAILVGISLILSYSLWSYHSSDRTTLQEDDALLGEDVITYDGEIESMRSLIKPNLIIFDKYDNYFGFSSPSQRYSLYEEMKSWVLYNFRESEANGPPNEGEQIEIIFPVELPMEIIPSLFTVNNEESVFIPENLDFERLYITFRNDHSLTFNFLSTDHRKIIKADVNNAQKYEILKNYMTTLEGLEEYSLVENTLKPIYLPIESVDMQIFKYTAVALEPEILKNTLFKDTSQVKTNVSEDGEIWFVDGQRTMQVYKDKINMEYNNLQEPVKNPMSAFELLDASITNINSYKGWTQDYYLESLDLAENKIRFQMSHRGYPIHHYGGLSTIEQVWLDHELIEHRQPLYRENAPSIIGTVELPSGKDVLYHLNNNNAYRLSEIQDIQVGYRLSYQNTSQYTIELNPAWFIKINDNWEQLYLNDELLRKGVN
ncbi:YycH family regulatory protein [Ornithinibacillus scapharcae]|uniref:YycH family regulatory protein n=1 Tax=Ornithinibacillus scapharcae TaxID=1147159 RepID=UPI000225B80E|nr:two-component system activity regulator YycH [Ornithinibacillus scapharcae]